MVKDFVKVMWSFLVIKHLLQTVKENVVLMELKILKSGMDNPQ